MKRRYSQIYGSQCSSEGNFPSSVTFVLYMKANLPSKVKLILAPSPRLYPFLLLPLLSFYQIQTTTNYFVQAIGLLSVLHRSMQPLFLFILSQLLLSYSQSDGGKYISRLSVDISD